MPSRIDDRWSVTDCGFETPCWIWNLALGTGGYGIEQQSHAVTRNAHRAAYERAHGSLPAGQHVHHRCGEKRCVRPDHLQALAPTEHRRLHARLTAAEVEAIRHMADSGVLQDRIGAQFGISQSYVSRLINRKRWS